MPPKVQNLLKYQQKKQLASTSPVLALLSSFGFYLGVFLGMPLITKDYLSKQLCLTDCHANFKEN